MTANQRRAKYEQILRSNEGIKKKKIKNQIMRAPKGDFSDCSKNYFMALMNPWQVDDPPCVPDSIVLPTYKFAASIRGTFSTGSSGLGFVTLNPYLAAYGIASNQVAGIPQPCGIITNANYTDNNYVPTGTTSNSTNQITSDSTLVAQSLQTDGSLMSNYNIRVVGAGLKVRYVGSEFSRSGRMLAYRTPDNGAIQIGINPTQILVDREIISVPVERKWHHVVWRPSNALDTGFFNYSTLPNKPFSTLGVFVEGAGGAINFEFDGVVWLEVVQNTNSAQVQTPGLPRLTPSHSDPIGMSAAVSALPQTQPTQDPSSDLKSFMSSAYDYVKTAISFVGDLVPTVLPQVVKMLT